MRTNKLIIFLIATVLIRYFADGYLQLLFSGPFETRFFPIMLLRLGGSDLLFAFFDGAILAFLFEKSGVWKPMIMCAAVLVIFQFIHIFAFNSSEIFGLTGYLALSAPIVSALVGLMAGVLLGVVFINTVRHNRKATTR